MSTTLLASAVLPRATCERDYWKRLRNGRVGTRWWFVDDDVCNDGSHGCSEVVERCLRQYEDPCLPTCKDASCLVQGSLRIDAHRVSNVVRGMLRLLRCRRWPASLPSADNRMEVRKDRVSPMPTVCRCMRAHVARRDDTMLWFHGCRMGCMADAEQ